MRRVIQAAVVGAMALAAAGAGLSSASADSGLQVKGAVQCEQVVAKYGYIVGPGVKGACAVLEPPPPSYGERLDCQMRLEQLGVETGQAREACWA
jgi:hypothetical protein